MSYKKKAVLLLGILLLNVAAKAQLLLPKFDSPVKIESISTEGEEIAPIPFAKGDKLFFVRTNINGGAKDRKNGQEIWESKRVNGKWAPPVNIFEEANDRGNNGVIGSSKDGNKIYVFNSIQSRRKLARGIAATERKENKGWSSLEKIKIEGFEVGEGYYSFYINSEEDVLLISKPANKNTVNEDLFVSLKKEGVWGEIINLGTTINTNGYEISPYLTEDKKALYFASNGHGGMGSADIFVSYRLGDSWTDWTNPLNLGAPINSSKFDAYFTIGNNREVFFSSNREGNFSSIYTTKISDEISVKNAREVWVENQFLYKGLPVDGVRLKVYDSEGELVDSLITDGYGKFNFKKLSQDNTYFIQIDEKDLTDYPGGGAIYEIDDNGNKRRKYILTKDGMYADINSFNSKGSMVGTFKYKNLPLENAPLLVIDEFGNIVDTIYTDENGKFNYHKLDTDKSYSFKPMNIKEDFDAYVLEIEDPKSNLVGKFTFESLPLENSAILVLDESGVVVDTIYTDETGRFNYKKLTVDQSYSFKPLNIEDSAYEYELESTENMIGGKFNFKNLPLENSAILVIDESGVVVDTIYTDETGRFNYKKLNTDQTYSFEPLNLEDNSDGYTYEMVLPGDELKGVFSYKNLPFKNMAIIVLDESGLVLDTIYTDDQGGFKYKKLNQEEGDKYNFKPLKLEDEESAYSYILLDPNSELTGTFKYKNLPLSNSAILVLDESGSIVDTIYTDELGSFKYRKLRVDGNYTFSPIETKDVQAQEIQLDDAEFEKIKGVFIYNELPASNTALVLFDKDGTPLDTIYTDESGKFEYTKLKTDGEYLLKPLNESDPSLQETSQIDSKNDKTEAVALIVYFEYNEAILSEKDKSSLRTGIIRLKENNMLRVLLTGHSDNIGSQKNNVKISRMRAESVKEFLIKQGVSDKRIVVEYKGDSDPMKTNETAEGRAYNRRVEVVFK